MQNTGWHFKFGVPGGGAGVAIAKKEDEMQRRMVDMEYPDTVRAHTALCVFSAVRRISLCCAAVDLPHHDRLAL